MTQPDELLRFYFDYISHNAYIAWTQLPKLEQRYGLAIEPIPVLFAGLLEAHDQLGPAEVWPKAQWMGRNVLRKAALLGVPINPPKHHPYNPLPSLRISSLELPAADRRRLIDALFRAVWVESQHLAEPEVIERAADAAGLPGRELVARSRAPEIKAQLRQQTDDAIAAGVFGVPTIIVAGELFFGYDDFPYMERVLAGNDPLEASTLERWKKANITPSAQRSRSRR